jgi:hypothetical protein
MDFEEYSKEIEEATNNINLKLSSTTKRKGKLRFRDRLIFGKYAWQESLSFLSILQTIVIFMALIPSAVVSLNAFLGLIRIPVVFPLHLSSLVSVGFIIFIFFFGIIAVRFLGTITSANEIGAKMNPGNYLLYEKLEELEKKVDELNEKNKTK